MTPRPPAPPTEPALAAVAGLAREVEGLRLRIDNLADVGDRVGELASLVADLADRLLAEAPVPASPARWLGPVAPSDRLGAESYAVTVLLDLCPWVSEIYLRYADAAPGLPECWPWHPEVVEELLWLRQAWAAAYCSPAASVQAAGDWHDRLRPGVSRRVRAAAGMCAPERHRGDEVAGPITLPSAVAEAVARWWVLDRHGPAPAAADLLRSPTARRLT